MLTFIDDHSRFVLGSAVLDRPFRTKDVIKLFNEVIIMFCKPKQLFQTMDFNEERRMQL